MVKRVINKQCLRCNGSFLTYETNKIYCNEDCRVKHLYEANFGKIKEKKEKRCIGCQKLISFISTKAYCDPQCKRAYVYYKDNEERTKASNEKIKNKPKGTSISVLIKKNEYKRLYDNFHINRIIRGKGINQG